MTMFHRDVGNIKCSDLIGEADDLVLQQIRELFVFLSRFGKIGFGIDSVEAHLVHEPFDELPSCSQSILLLQQLSQFPYPRAGQLSMPIVNSPFDLFFPLQDSLVWRPSLMVRRPSFDS